MAFVIYPTIMKFFVKRLSFKSFLKGISPAQVLAFSTSSSAATLPVTIECVEDNLKVDPKVSSFVLPIGARAIQLGEKIGVHNIVQKWRLKATVDGACNCN